MRDWPLLAQAVAQKIEEQAEFVAWWREKVRGPGKANSRGPAGISCDAAETLTGITNQQVSKWAKALRNIPAYQARRGVFLGISWGFGLT